MSPSRGILYSAPPKKTTRDEDDESIADETAESANEEATPVKTDANWVGTVSADD